MRNMERTERSPAIVLKVDRGLLLFGFFGGILLLMGAVCGARPPAAGGIVCWNF